MATVAALSISRTLGPHPVGQFYPGMRGNPLAAAKLTAIPAVFTQNSPAIAVNSSNLLTENEHYCIAQYTASVDIVITPPGADPNATGLIVQTILVPAGGIASYGAILRPGENEVHIKSTT